MLLPNIITTFLIILISHNIIIMITIVIILLIIMITIVIILLVIMITIVIIFLIIMINIVIIITTIEHTALPCSECDCPHFFRGQTLAQIFALQSLFLFFLSLKLFKNIERMAKAVLGPNLLWGHNWIPVIEGLINWMLVIRDQLKTIQSKTASKVCRPCKSKSCNHPFSLLSNYFQPHLLSWSSPPPPLPSSWRWP